MKHRLRRTEVRELREKYERMLALRIAHDRARSDPSYVEPDPRPEMKKLAAMYPGALREIDVLPVPEIKRRITALLTLEQDDAKATNAEPWMIAQATFHSLARGALVTKLWLRGRKRITAVTRAAFASAVGTSITADARAFADDLPSIASPPRGRLMDVVFAKLARALDVTEAEARLLVFGSRRR